MLIAKSKEWELKKKKSKNFHLSTWQFLIGLVDCLHNAKKTLIVLIKSVHITQFTEKKWLLISKQQ